LKSYYGLPHTSLYFTLQKFFYCAGNYLEKQKVYNLTSHFRYYDTKGVVGNVVTDLTEQFEIQTKNARKKVQKDFWFNQYPSLKNLGIEYERADYISSMELVVTDLLSVQEGGLKTHALSTRPTGSTHMIDSIQCPVCKSSVMLNENWPVFICDCGQHPKKIFEIKSVEPIDRIPKIIQFEDEDNDW